MTRLPYGEDPSIDRLELQVRADIERLRRRINEQRAPAPTMERRRSRRTGRLYQVVSSCFGDPNLEG
jgi:hypothetical protein